MFQVWPLRLEFQAIQQVVIPPGHGGNTFRGAFGLRFRQLACHPACHDPKACSQNCPYAHVFEPRWPDGPSGLREAPRPFVLRATAAEGRHPPGVTFALDIHLFSGRPDLPAWFESVFQSCAQAGLGTARGRADLVSFARQPSLTLDLTPRANATQLTIHFRTPTELKGGDLEFGTLLRRILGRAANLATLYQQPLDINFPALLAQADQVRLTEQALTWHDTERKSTRTGQRHSIGGFTGHLCYQGELGPFLPWLELARWTGVGRQTVWGKGDIQPNYGLPSA